MLSSRPASSGAPAALYAAFFLSGSAAIIYQLIWQRVLSGVYGVTVEAVTTVVAAFMIGLGVGSLAGGWIAGRWPFHAPKLFVAAELAIGVFGWASVSLFRAVGAATLVAGPALTWLIVGGLLLLPTFLMGATLPVLTAGIAPGRNLSVGDAVGRLYAVNTLGAAAGSVITVLFVAGTFGQQGSALCAAMLNLIAAMLVWVTRRSW